jgi:hypothetical protein
LDCKKYLTNYLSAHADGQLTAHERRIADLHARRCRACRCCLAEERFLKALVSCTQGIVRTPIAVRMRIRNALREPIDKIPTDRLVKSLRCQSLETVAGSFIAPEPSGKKACEISKDMLTTGDRSRDKSHQVVEFMASEVQEGNN